MGRMRARARPLVDVESDCGYADPTALWTGKGLGWGKLQAAVSGIIPSQKEVTG